MRTVISAIKELHETDESIVQYISQGVFFTVASENLDISAGGVLCIQHKGETAEKTTETRYETTLLDLCYFHKSMETLNQIIVPWVKARFDDSEEDDAKGIFLVDDAYVSSCDVNTVNYGCESVKDKNGQNVFSAVVELEVKIDKDRTNT